MWFQYMCCHMARSSLGGSGTAFDLGAALGRHGTTALLALVLLIALATGGAAAESLIDPMGGGGSADPGP